MRVTGGAIWEGRVEQSGKEGWSNLGGIPTGRPGIVPPHLAHG